MTSALVVLITAPSEDAAAALARTLVDERLLACANIVPRVRSIYRWQGEVHDEAEALLACKTTTDRLEDLKARVPQLHPYDTPEFIALPLTAGAKRYLEWIDRNCAAAK